MKRTRDRPGDGWEKTGLIGKIAATAMAVGCVILGAAVGFRLGESRYSGPVPRIVAGIAGGVAGTFVSPIAGLIGACVLTQDCL